MIGTFTEKYPEVTVALRVEDTEKIIQEVLFDDLELGVVGAESRDKKIVQEKLIDDDLRLIVPRNHPWARRKSIPLELLLTEPFIVREKGSGTLTAIQQSLASTGQRIENLKIVAELGSTEAIRQGIKNNLGVSILSTLAVSEELESGSLKAIAVNDLQLKRSFFLTRQKNRSLSPLNRIFIEFLKKGLKDYSTTDLKGTIS